MRIFKTKVFRRFQRKERMADVSLVDAIGRAERGLVDADLGSGLIKQRIARAGAGKSGGHRTIIAYRRGDRAVFLYGFSKSDRENISAEDLTDLAETGAAIMAFSPRALERMIGSQVLFEVRNEEDAD